MTIDTIRATLEPHTQQFVYRLAGASPIYSLSPDEARSVLVRAQSLPVGKPSAKIEDTAFSVGSNRIGAGTDRSPGRHRRCLASGNLYSRRRVDSGRSKNP